MKANRYHEPKSASDTAEDAGTPLSHGAHDVCDSREASSCALLWVDMAVGRSSAEDGFTALKRATKNE